MVSSAVMTVFGGGCPASDCQTEVLVSDLSCHDMLCGVFTPGFRCYACVKCITRLNSVSMNRRHSVELENVREKTITRRTSEPTKDAKNARSPFFFSRRVSAPHFAIIESGCGLRYRPQVRFPPDVSRVAWFSRVFRLSLFTVLTFC